MAAQTQTVVYVNPLDTSCEPSLVYQGSPLLMFLLRDAICKRAGCHVSFFLLVETKPWGLLFILGSSHNLP